VKLIRVRYVSHVARVLRRIVRWNISRNPFFIGFWNVSVSLISLIMMLDTPSDRARRTASTDVSFARGTDRGSNIFAEYFICSLFRIEKNHIFINI
jgi:hypothetical protein